MDIYNNILDKLLIIESFSAQKLSFENVNVSNVIEEAISHHQHITIHKNIKIDFSEILIFNGFRSLHSHSISKAHVEKEKARLIIHVFNPFHDNKINQLIFKNIQKKRVIKN